MFKKIKFVVLKRLYYQKGYIEFRKKVRENKKVVDLAALEIFRFIDLYTIQILNCARLYLNQLVQIFFSFKELE